MDLGSLTPLEWLLLTVSVAILLLTLVLLVWSMYRYVFCPRPSPQTIDKLQLVLPQSQFPLWVPTVPTDNPHYRVLDEYHRKGHLLSPSPTYESSLRAIQEEAERRLSTHDPSVPLLGPVYHTKAVTVTRGRSPSVDYPI